MQVSACAQRHSASVARPKESRQSNAAHVTNATCRAPHAHTTSYAASVLHAGVLHASLLPKQVLLGHRSLRCSLHLLRGRHNRMLQDGDALNVLLLDASVAVQVELGLEA
jgi:hypothetical protein